MIYNAYPGGESVLVAEKDVADIFSVPFGGTVLFAKRGWVFGNAMSQDTGLNKLVYANGASVDNDTGLVIYQGSPITDSNGETVSVSDPVIEGEAYGDYKGDGVGSRYWFDDDVRVHSEKVFFVASRGGIKSAPSEVYTFTP